MPNKWDALLILSLLILSCLPMAIFGKPAQASSIYADITIDGELYKRIPLTAHHGHDEMEIHTKYGSNTVEVEDETIAIIDADCPDGICIAMGKASKPGNIIVCLPHKLVIEVKSSTDAPASDIIPAH